MQVKDPQEKKIADSLHIGVIMKYAADVVSPLFMQKL